MAQPTIINIREVIPDDYAPFYFFDSNVWMAILSSTGNPKVEYQPYIDFFDIIAAIHIQRKGNPKFEKMTRYFPEIVMPPLVLTEIINASIRNASNSYFDALGTLPNNESPNFKKHYRPTEEYKRYIRALLSEIDAHRGYLNPMENGRFTPFPLLNSLHDFNPDYDLNDFYFASLMRQNNIPIVTHDRDYMIYEGITIITANQRLLKI